MTTMFNEFFGVPQGIVRLGKLKSLSGVAVKLYVALLHQSERYRTRVVRCTTTELEQLTGCSRNSLITARAQLERAGLVHAEPNGVQGFILHLCDPKTGKPWPGDPKQRIPYDKKSAASHPVATDAAAIAKPKVDSGIEITSFKHPQSETVSSRADSAVAECPMTSAALPVLTWDFEELTDTRYLGDTSFPYGYNAPDPRKSRCNPVVESLREIFD